MNKILISELFILLTYLTHAQYCAKQNKIGGLLAPSIANQLQFGQI